MSLPTSSAPAQNNDMDYRLLIDKYYPEDNALKRLLLQHSLSVARKALQIVAFHPRLHLDSQFVEEAAMLHDIGVFRCDAPGISCFGKEPYIRHGLLGAEILRSEGLERHARVAERHTGTGLTVESIRLQELPLPLRDFSPETIEEKLICWADKFFSKTPSKLTIEKTNEQVVTMLSRFPDGNVDRFLEWSELFD